MWRVQPLLATLDQNLEIADIRKSKQGEARVAKESGNFKVCSHWCSFSPKILKPIHTIFLSLPFIYIYTILWKLFFSISCMSPWLLVWGSACSFFSLLAFWLFCLMSCLRSVSMVCFLFLLLPWLCHRNLIICGLAVDMDEIQFDLW